jgi:hypothetical protein
MSTGNACTHWSSVKVGPPIRKIIKYTTMQNTGDFEKLLRDSGQPQMSGNAVPKVFHRPLQQQDFSCMSVILSAISAAVKY